VAGCDTTDVRVGYSSQGPGMIPTDANHSKPDVTAYTHFLGSEVRGVGMPDPGTSTACPVAAGCVAALRTKDPAAGRLTPAQMIEALRGSARLAPGQAKKDNDFGCGIINPLALATALGLMGGK